MARPHKHWYWKAGKCWCVTVGKVRHKLGPDKQAAETLFHELMLALPKELPGGTYAELVDRFLDWAKTHKPASADWYEHHIQKFLDYLEDKLILIRDLTPDLVLSFVERDSWGDSTRRGYIIAIVRPLNWALKRGIIQRNPLRGIDKPPQGKRDEFISAAEYKAILKAASPEFRLVLEMAWNTGARPQELTKVEARHVDLEDSRWVFPQNESKGKKRKRVVYLNDAALKLTIRLMKKYPEGPLLRNAFGKPWHRYSSSHAFRRLKEKVGKRYCLYAFRHTFITNGLKRGVDPITMQNLVGHNSLAMISTIYAHVSHDTNHMRNAAAKAVV